MFEVMKTSIVKAINFVKRFIKPNEKAPTIDVNITINGGDIKKVDVSLSSKE